MSANPTVDFYAPDTLAGGLQIHEARLNAAEKPVAPFRASIFTVPAGASSPRDQHEVRECWVVLAGTGVLTTDAGTQRLDPNTMTYFASNQPHEVRNDGSTPLRIFSVWWSGDAD
jgi:mannose-6-phosphate isomerase-like protein (cupin superfamily)